MTHMGSEDMVKLHYDEYTFLEAITAQISEENKEPDRKSVV